MPDWKEQVRSRVARAGLRPEREAEIVEELAQHLDDRYRQMRSAGVSADGAVAEVLAELEHTDLLNAQLRESEPIARPPVGLGFGGDLRYALRTFRRAPGFAAFAVLTLALGIGAATGVFTIVNLLLLDPLPVRDPARLTGLESIAGTAPARQPIAYATLREIAARNQVFEAVAGLSTVNALRVERGGRTERFFAEFATANIFDVLGIKPAVGRFFDPQDDAPGSHPFAVLSYTAWQQRFGGAPDIVGRTLRVNAVSEVTVIGVAPEGFRGITVVFGPDLWMPASEWENLFPQQRGVLADRTRTAFRMFARLKGGIAPGAAEANLRVVHDALRRQYPEMNREERYRLIAIGRAAQGDFAGPLVQGSVVLFAIAASILLICCSNAAGLFLARAGGRRQEIAVRLALGASRTRLVRQLLTECLLLALAAGALGLALAWEGCRLLWSMRPAEVALNFVELRLDGQVIAFALGASLLTALIFGLIPAIQASRPQVIDAIKEAARTAGRTRSLVTFRNLLLVGQVAFSLVTLVVAALFLRGMERAYGIDPGFQTAHLAIVMTNQGQAGYDEVRADAFYREARDRLLATPGIASATWSSNLPIWTNPSRPVLVEGMDEQRPQNSAPIVTATVGLDYFAAMAIPLVAGRDFGRFDAAAAPAVAIVNQSFAQRYWPGQDALGKRFRFYGERQFRAVVGIARTATYTSLGEAPQPCAYLPLAQNPSANLILYVRTHGDPARMLAAVQRVLNAIDPKLDVSDARTGLRVFEQALFAPRIIVGLLGVFGLAGLALASVGLYGIVAHTMAQRRREIGVRVALGASPRTVRWMVVGEGMTMVGAGLLLGSVLALLAGRGLSRMLYGISSADPLSFLAAAGVLTGAGFLACYVPARRASRMDPLAALRDD